MSRQTDASGDAPVTMGPGVTDYLVDADPVTGEPVHFFHRRHPRLDACMRRHAGGTFWQVRMLPGCPDGKARILCQRGSFEEAVRACEGIVDRMESERKE